MLLSLADCRDPLVVPFYHSGMGRVLPKTKIVPRWGNEIHVSVGQPVDLADQLAACRAAQDRTARQQVGCERLGVSSWTCRAFEHRLCWRFHSSAISQRTTHLQYLKIGGCSSTAKLTACCCAGLEGDHAAHQGGFARVGASQPTKLGADTRAARSRQACALSKHAAALRLVWPMSSLVVVL